MSSRYLSRNGLQFVVPVILLWCLVGITAEIEPATGRLLCHGGWDGGLLLYEWRTSGDSRHASELGDVVLRTQEEDAGGRLVECTNAFLPGVVIRKRYRPQANGGMLQSVSFQGNAPEAILSLRLAMKRPEGAFLLRHGADEVLRSAGCLTFSRKEGSLLVRRTKVNGHPVRRGPPPAEVANWLILPLMSDFLREGEEIGVEIAYELFEKTDFTVLLQRLAKARLPWCGVENTRPWSRELLADIMYVTGKNAKFLEKCHPHPVTGTIWMLNPPWGNWWAESDPPKSKHPNVKNIARSLSRQFPFYRIAAYSNACIDDASAFFREHPGALLRCADGSLHASGIPSDYQRRPAYLLRINDPEVRSILVAMHCDRTEKWGLRFFYTDSPGFFHEWPDWSRREVVQEYHWNDYLRELLAALRRIDDEIVLFSNGDMPWAAIRYVEWRDANWKEMGGKDWRKAAVRLLGTRLLQPPWQTTVFTYGHAAAEPAFCAYLLYYGAAAHLAKEWQLPYAKAALSIRGGTLRPDLLVPHWYEEEASSYEAMLLTYPNASVRLNLLGHQDGAEAKLRWKATAAGMKPGARYRATLLRAPPCQPDSAKGNVLSTEVFPFPERCPETIEVSLPVNKMTVLSLFWEEVSE